jgi:ferredoxin-NADP reductase/Na+-transporting NADH:ubiquinone oxidoreductase subunit NqrB
MKQPLRLIDKYLNAITMYRLVVYGLSVLLGGAIIFCFTGTLSLSGVAIGASLAVLLLTCYLTNRCLAILWGGASNSESWLITALILCCILTPSTSVHGLSLIALGGLIAMASKYIVVYRHKHLFNPAAFAAVVLGLSQLLPAIWWIGSPAMLALTTIFGLLLLRKLRRFQLFMSFLVASLVVAIAVGMMHHQMVRYVLETTIKSSPLVFLGTVMLTEPETMVPGIWQQLFYGALVGAVFTSQLSRGSISATPELALIIGNVYSFIVSPKYKLRLRFKTKQQLAPQVYELTFTSDQPLDFKPGQYLEWTLPHLAFDSRGNRRTFSIASAPGTTELSIAIKTFQASSNFKKALLTLQPGDSITVGQLGGYFTLPADTTQPLVFIAGGIGITPFLSMIKTMIVKQQKRDIVLFYFVSNPAEYCYKELWEKAAAFGVRVVPVLTAAESPAQWRGLTGRLNKDMLHKEVSAFGERRYYLSGPNVLVDNYRQLLRDLGVKPQAIVTDYFSGY